MEKGESHGQDVTLFTELFPRPEGWGEDPKEKSSMENSPSVIKDP